jgi:hypothetical protein
MSLKVPTVTRQTSPRSTTNSPIGGSGTIATGSRANRLRSSSYPNLADLARRPLPLKNNSVKTLEDVTPESRKVQSAAVAATIRNPIQEGLNLLTGLYPGVKTKKHPLAQNLAFKESSESRNLIFDRSEKSEDNKRLLEVEEIPTNTMVLTARDVDEFARNEILAIEEEIGKKRDFNPNLHRNALGLATDFPTIAQNLESTVLTMTGGTPDVGMAGGLKLSSTFAILTGLLTIQVATENVKKAHEIGDVAGEQLAEITQARGVTECSMGFVLGTLRGLTIASVYTAAQSVALAGKIFGDLSTAFASAFYILIAVPPAITATKQISFKQKFDAKLEENSDPYKKARLGIEFLMNELTLGNDEREEALSIIPIGKYDDLIRMFSQQVELSAEEYGHLSHADFAFIAEKTRGVIKEIQTNHPHMSNLEVASGHVKVRLAKELVRMMKVKEAELARNTGIETVRLVKDELRKPLQDRFLNLLESSEENELALQEANKIIEVASKENLQNMILNIFIVGTCVIGVIGFVLASVFTAGLPLYIALSIIILSNVMMFGIDLYSFAEEVKDMKATPKDRLIIIITSALSIVFTAVGAMLSVGPLVRLILILVGVLFAGFQLGVLGWSWYNDEKNQHAKTV